MNNFKSLKQPHAKHPVERIMEDVVRAAHWDCTEEEQTRVYNELMYDLFETIRKRVSKQQQPMRISEGNSVWKNYRYRYCSEEYQQAEMDRICVEMFDLYTGRIPGKYGKES